MEQQDVDHERMPIGGRGFVECKQQTANKRRAHL